MTMYMATSIYHMQSTSMSRSMSRGRLKDSSQAIRLIPTTNGPSSPVNLLVRYLLDRPRVQKDDYLFVTPSGKPIIQAQEVREVMSKVLIDLGRDPAKYSTHRFRKGGASCDLNVQKTAYWSSPFTTAEKRQV